MFDQESVLVWSIPDYIGAELRTKHPGSCPLKVDSDGPNPYGQVLTNHFRAISHPRSRVLAHRRAMGSNEGIGNFNRAARGVQKRRAPVGNFICAGNKTPAFGDPSK